MYLGYVGIRVRDLERSLKFYKETFGLEEVARGDNIKFGAGLFVLLRDRKSGMKLELNWYPKGSKYDTPYVSGEALDHIAFRVDDMKETYRRLVKKGVEPTDFGPDTGASYAYV
ncbi:MAG TPA: VOC family protein [Nitrososphaerales archaeon]|nr:VOC family protein [Nitrososphaerales archaeon]